MQLKLTLRKAKVATLVGALAATGVLIAPASAADRTTVVLTQPTPLSSLNSSTPDTNLATNSEVMYPTGFGFYYGNNVKKIVPNTRFGTWKVTNKSATDFRVQYTVRSGQKWSDGTPIDAVDLLLTHVLSSSDYAKAAGLGDPKAGPSAFDSLGYGGPYDDNIKSVVLSDNKMQLELRYGAIIPDWELYAPGPYPVHALSLLADGKTKLGTASENLAAKAKFLADYESKNTARLKAMGKVWSKDYNITTVNSSTNPLLLVGNGNFEIQSCVDQVSCTLVLNKDLNGQSGPKANGIDKIVFRFDVADTSAPQALANKEIDLYAGQVTADGLTQLKNVKGIRLSTAPQSTYEQISLRTAGPNLKGAYNGPFAGNSRKAQALRRAFLLAVPREDMIAKIIKPTDPDAVVLNSRTYMPSDGAGYTSFIAKNRSGSFSASYDARIAEAQKLMDLYAKGWRTKPIEVKFVARNNARRTAQFNLYAQSWAKVGFKVTGDLRADWSTKLSDTSYDGALFAWGAGLPTQPNDCPQVKSDSPNSTFGWSSDIILQACKELESSALSTIKRDALWLKVEQELLKNAYTLPLFQWPGVTAVNSDLKNVKPSPITPNLVWNYWEWTY